MRGIKLLILISLISISGRIFSQDYFAYGGSNYTPLNQVLLNPAAIAGSKLKCDVILSAYDLTVNNSWFGINKSALRYSGSIFHPKSIRWPSSWRNLTPNVPNNVYKNFNFVSSGNGVAFYFESRFIYPSAMVQINETNSIAFTRCVRQMANLDGISDQFAKLFEKELDLNVTQNNRVQNAEINAIEMTWAEYGLSYARVIYNKQHHVIKAGITPKLLYGIESTYLTIKDLDFLLSSKDTLSYFNASVSYAHSDRGSSPLHVKPPLFEMNHFVTGPSLGMDLGIVYEWRPAGSTSTTGSSGKGLFKARENSSYKIKFGASVTDLGKIKYTKVGRSYDLDLAITNKDITTFTSINNLNMLDSMLRANYSKPGTSDHYSVQLPAAINFQLDIAFAKGVFLNFSGHIANLNKWNSFRVHNYTGFCIAPRIEHYWFDVSVPITFNALSAQRGEYISAGLALRAGPLSIGANNIIQDLRGDVRALNYYAMLRFSLPQKEKKPIPKR